MTDTSDFVAMERNGWGTPSIAKRYADGFEAATRLVAGKLADKVSAGAGVEVLDLCTGHGVVAKELVARGARVTGLDFSEPMIALAKSFVPSARFLQGDAMAMEFADESFDAVTIGFGVPHFPDPAGGLSEAARVLKSGGRLAFSIWRGRGSNGSFGWLFDAVERLADPSITLPHGPDAHALVEKSVATPILERAGFTDVKLVDVPSEVSLPNPTALFDLFDGGAVRAASLLSQQPLSRRQAIKEDLAMRVRLEGTKQEQAYIVPAPSVVVSAVRA